jgi:hypothetical protein
VVKLYAIDTPADQRSITSQSEFRKMGMKTTSLPGKIRFSIGYRSLVIGDSPKALPQALAIGHRSLAIRRSRWTR